MTTVPLFRSLKRSTGCLVAVVLLLVTTGFLSSAWGCSVCAGLGSDVYVRAHITIEESTLKRLDIRWQLSESLRQSLVASHDIDEDGVLDSEEQQALEKILSRELRSQEYHTTLIVDEQKLTSLSFENQRLEWQASAPSFFMFSIPVHKRVGDGLHLRLITHDPELNMLFYHVQDSVTWNDPDCCRLSDNSHLFPKELEMNILPLK